MRQRWRQAEHFLRTVESALKRLLRSCWVLCRVALAFLALWYGVVYRGCMAGLSVRFNKISIAAQLLRSAVTWSAGHQRTIPAQLFVSVLPWALSVLLDDQVMSEVEGQASVSPVTTDVSQLLVLGFKSSTVRLATQEATFLRRCSAVWRCAGARCPLLASRAFVSSLVVGFLGCVCAWCVWGREGGVWVCVGVPFRAGVVSLAAFMNL